MRKLISMFIIALIGTLITCITGCGGQAASSQLDNGAAMHQVIDQHGNVLSSDTRQTAPHYVSLDSAGLTAILADYRSHASDWAEALDNFYTDYQPWGSGGSIPAPPLVPGETDEDAAHFSSKIWGLPSTVHNASNTLTLWGYGT